MFICADIRYRSQTYQQSRNARYLKEPARFLFSEKDADLGTHIAITRNVAIARSHCLDRTSILDFKAASSRFGHSNVVLDVFMETRFSLLIFLLSKRTSCKSSVKCLINRICGTFDEVKLFWSSDTCKAKIVSPRITSIQYCGRCSVLRGIASVHVGDSISTVEAIQYCGVEFLAFLHFADIANRKLSTIYNFETKIALDFYRNWQLG